MRERPHAPSVPGSVATPALAPADTKMPSLTRARPVGLGSGHYGHLRLRASGLSAPFSMCGVIARSGIGGQCPTLETFTFVDASLVNASVALPRPASSVVGDRRDARGSPPCPAPAPCGVSTTIGGSHHSPTRGPRQSARQTWSCRGTVHPPVGRPRPSSASPGLRADAQRHGHAVCAGLRAPSLGENPGSGLMSGHRPLCHSEVTAPAPITELPRPPSHSFPVP